MTLREVTEYRGAEDSRLHAVRVCQRRVREAEIQERHNG